MGNTLETEQATTIKKIFGILELYADLRWEEGDWVKVSTEIYELVLSDVISKLLKKDLEISDNMKDIWKHLNSGAER